MEVGEVITGVWVSPDVTVVAIQWDEDMITDDAGAELDSVPGDWTRVLPVAVTEQQPEPVSQDELGALVIQWWKSEHAIHVLTRELLSRYIITARPVASPPGESLSYRDRDELAIQIAHPGAPAGMEITPDNCTLCRQAAKTADHVLSLGWRRSTVTPEQIEAAGIAIHDEFVSIDPPEFAADAARAAARAFGLSMAEDGES